MKNNTFKRVMAGTLAVLTVASPMTANVGGFLTGSVAIVANAVDAAPAAPVTTPVNYSINWTDASAYLTKYNTLTDAETLRTTQTINQTSDKEITFSSKVPLSFTASAAPQQVQIAGNPYYELNDKEKAETAVYFANPKKVEVWVSHDNKTNGFKMTGAEIDDMVEAYKTAKEANNTEAFDVTINGTTYQDTVDQLENSLFEIVPEDAKWETAARSTDVFEEYTIANESAFDDAKNNPDITLYTLSATGGTGTAVEVGNSDTYDENKTYYIKKSGYAFDATSNNYGKNLGEILKEREEDGVDQYAELATYLKENLFDVKGYTANADKVKVFIGGADKTADFLITGAEIDAMVDAYKNAKENNTGAFNVTVNGTPYQDTVDQLENSLFEIVTVPAGAIWHHATIPGITNGYEAVFEENTEIQDQGSLDDALNADAKLYTINGGTATAVANGDTYASGTVYFTLKTGYAYQNEKYGKNLGVILDDRSEEAGVNAATDYDLLKTYLKTTLLAENQYLISDKYKYSEDDGATWTDGGATTFKTSLENVRIARAWDDTKDTKTFTLPEAPEGATNTENCYKLVVSGSRVEPIYNYSLTPTKAVAFHGATSVASLKVGLVEQKANVTVPKKSAEGAATENAITNLQIDGKAVTPEALTGLTGEKTTDTKDMSFNVGEVVTVTAAEPFGVTVNDNNNSNNLIKPTLTYKNSVYTASFTMPASASKDPVKVTIAKADTNYTYTVNDGKLLVSSNDNVVQNAEAAIMDVSYTDSSLPADSQKVNVADKAELSFGTKVHVEAYFAKDFVKEGALTVTRDGVKLTPTVANNVYNFTATDAGVYVVTYTVTDKKGSTQTITKTFTIKSKEPLKAENVKLTLYKKSGGAPLGTATAKTGSTATFMLKEDVAKEFAEKPFEFTVSAAINDGTTDVKTGYEITGSVSGSTLNQEYVFTVKVFDEKYGGSAANPKTFTVSWKVTSYVEDAAFNPSATVDVAKDKIDTLEDKIFDAIKTNETTNALKSSMEYMYVEGDNGADIAKGEEELDEKIEGLPTESGVYTVYAYSNDVLKSIVKVNIKAFNLFATTAEKDLKITYGSQFKSSAITLSDEAGKVVTSVKAENVVWTAYEAEKNNKDEFVKKTGGKSYNLNNLAAEEEEEFIPAGTYILVATKADSADENYAISGKEQVLTVAKKNITADMISIDPISLKDAKNGYDIVNPPVGTPVVVTAVDPVTNKEINVKITEGTKEKTIGEYTCKVALDDNNATGFANANYTGTTNAKWHIVANEGTEKTADNQTNVYQTGLEWDLDKTTLYDNGRIHVEISRNANDKVVYTNAAGAESVIKVAEFGVVLDKSGKLDRPKNYKSYSTDEKNAAKAILVRGNGYVDGYYDATTSYTAYDNQIYKANIKVKDAQTGIWARPFVKLENGEVVYGEVRYICLEDEAKNRLGLRMPMAGKYDPVLDKTYNNTTQAIRRADLKDAKPGNVNICGGYDPVNNKYYAYANFTDLETAGFTDVLEVSKFGVVLDKTGKNAANASVEDVSKELVLGNGYIEGNYDKKNTVLKTNEYAANITPKDSVTGIWVRTYLDLGNGLIVYGDPVYVQSASKYFASELNEELSVTPISGNANNKMQINLTVSTNLPVSKVTGTGALNPIASDKIKLTKVGVVVDKKGVITFADTSDATKEATLNAELLATNKSLIIGGKTTNLGDPYKAKLTPEGQDFYIRSYAIYDIDGVQVTVYGDVQTYKYNASAAVGQKYENSSAKQ